MRDKQGKKKVKKKKKKKNIYIETRLKQTSGYKEQIFQYFQSQTHAYYIIQPGNKDFRL
jgi:hypothetical protein